LFDRQWSRLRSVCADAGVALFGDLPIFVALDSADVLAHRELFLLGPSGRPEVVAGVPPDAFTEKGQLWGMPLYDWSTHAEQGFRWWIDRVDALLARVDRVRIDHFRGFAAAWHVPAGDRDATGGAWVPGPGAALFEALRARFPALPIVAEDLGVITDDVVALRDGFGLPGMRILQFAFGGDPAHPYLPANHVENCVVYTGTHDNDTACGWWRAIGDDERSRVEAVLGREVREPGWDLIELAARSVASLAMFPAQDVLGLGSDARMNVPGTVVGNWGFRLADLPGPTIARRLRSLLIESGRCR
jgi:4-alpha-glucanotransferase